MPIFSRDEAIERYGVKVIESIEAEQNKRAIKSYEDSSSEKKFCPNCGQLLVNNSMSYFEGFHFDSCY